MKAVQVVSRGRAEFVDVAKPDVRPGHVLVRTTRLALCGSDIRMLHYAAESSYPFPPGTTGHEMVGIVEAIDCAASEIQVGDRVLALAPGHCAMAEFYLAPIEHVLPLPGEVPTEHLLQAQQLGTVLFACQRLPHVIGRNVVVIGQGSAGLWFDFQLRRMGARRVIALDLEPCRLARSQSFGATHIIENREVEAAAAIREINDGQLADIVIEAAGEIDSINLATDLVRTYGDILYFGVPRAQTFEYNFDRLFHKCCRASTIVGAFVEPDQMSTRMAIDLIAEGTAPASSLITHHFPFSHVMDAYETHHTRADGAIKIVVEMPD